jgi:hypothetical protein
MDLRETICENMKYMALAQDHVQWPGDVTFGAHLLERQLLLYCIAMGLHLHELISCMSRVSNSMILGFNIVIE